MKASPTKKRRFSVLSKLMKSTKEEKVVEEKSVLSVRKLPKVPLNLKSQIDTMVSGTVFDKLLLMEGDEDRLQFLDAVEFRKKQSTMYQTDVDQKVAEFIMEFNNMVCLIGDKPDVMRDMNFFLIKEVSKSYVYLQALMREFYSLDKVKEYLDAELTIQNVQCVILKKELQKARKGQS